MDTDIGDYLSKPNLMRILISAGSSTDRVVNCDRTLLHSAIERGLTEAVEILLNAGVDIDAVDDSGWTPLHYAVRYGNDETVALLISRGAKNL